MAITSTVITGATSGIGEATAFALANKGHALYLLVRDMQKGGQLKQRLISETGNKEIHIIQCDLADLESVAAAATELKARLFNINVLINNAGGMFNDFTESKNGFEMTFALNHLGHFLLTTSLMPLLEKGHARIINVSSDLHKAGKPDFEKLQSRKKYSAVKAYGNSKLFNIYFTKSLAEKYADKGITAYALHPGVVKTSFNSKLTGFLKFLFSLATPFMISPEKGAETTIYLATGNKLESKSGQYFIKKKVAKPASPANDATARNQLWELSEKLVAEFAL
ncbi:SDR family oxidoreductase [Mucilaginibacter sp. UR6-11]|uniref:SDR family oxidoreductase n=1 Tax=Mucilaginibacter sp. UR6-11 TaxID=1435644 RepID=UPI001E35E7E7|nr:SDR family oxidoreductase [Mucilaginibacter sp. UR6-11]MCC8423366.1 SDR family oxidoreductase [Mucilaginibacter sp. UR6-11]